MDKTKNTHDHTHTNHCNGTGTSINKGPRTRGRDLYTSSNNKTEGTPDGKRDHDRKRREGGGKSSGGRHKVAMPTVTQASPSSTNGTVANGNASSRYYYREVPPRFQLNNKHSGGSKQTGNSKSPHSKLNQGSNKKLKDGNNHWPSSTPGPTNNMWPQNPDNETMSTHGGVGSCGDRKEAFRARGNNPWGDDTHDSNLTSEDEFMNSDPLGEEMNSSDNERFSIGKKRSEDGSEVDELEMEGSTSLSLGIGNDQHGREGGVSHGSGRFRNSDSDAMKDGVSPSVHISDLQDEFLEGTGGEGGGRGGEGGLWRGHLSRSSMGSTSSVNSAGSSSSWKGGSTGSRTSNGGGNGGNNYQRAASPRKHGRYENHRNMSATSGKPVMKYPMKTKKHVDLDDALESLQNEPSGWGDLPSPKPADVDTGTEVWGIPDDIKVKMKVDPSGKGVIGNRGGPGWCDSTPSDEWGGKGSSLSAGWEQNPPGFVKGPINGSTDMSSQWASNKLSWNAAAKGNERSSSALKDNIKLLMDMGFLAGESEEMLCRNNNNFEAALGDLLALATVKEDEEGPPELSPSNFPSPSASIRGLHPRKTGNNRLSPASSSHSENTSPRTTSPSFVQVAQENVFQIPSTELQTSTVGSTPVTPTCPPNHLLQMLQQQQQSQKLTRSLSAPQSSTSVNTPYIQKVLTEHLKEYQSYKQTLMNQMKNLQSPKHQHMLTMKLNEVNSSIILVKQHLLLADQLAMQQQQKRLVTGSGEGKGPVVGKEPIGTPSSLSQGSEGFSQESQSTIGDVKSLGYSMQNVSLSGSGSVDTPTVSESSARTVSKLHKIISGSQESMNTEGFADANVHNVALDDKQHGGSGELLPIGTRRSIPSPIAPSTPGFNTTTKVEMVDVTSALNISSPMKTQQPSLSYTSTQHGPSASVTNSGKFARSVDEIPEFKPGVPWNPNPMLPSHQTFNQPKKMSHRSDNRPDSIPLSSHPYSSKESSSFVIPGGPRSADMDYYPSPSDPLPNSFGTTHMPPPQQYRRPGTSPGMGPNNPRFGGSGNYSSTPGGGGGGGYNNSGYFNRQQSGHGFPRPSPQTPTGQMFPQNQFNPPPPTGSRNRQRLYSQQSVGGGYNEMGQRNRGFDSGRKWSFDGNPWGVPEKSGSSIWSVDSTESLLSPSLSSEMGFSPSAEWKAPPHPSRKPSLPVHLTAPTNYVLLKNVPPQVDEHYISEISSEYGHVQNCAINMFNGTALICYRSKEEAMQAKLGLEKNSFISGANILPSFASEKVIATFAEQRTPSHSYGLPPPPQNPASSWLSPSDHISSPQRMIPSIGGTRTPFNTNHTMQPSQQEHLVRTEPANSSMWGREFSAPGGPTMSAPGSSNSVWSNRGILPGISTPWNAQSNNNTMPEGGADDNSSNLMGTSPSLSTLLPNGLF